MSLILLDSCIVIDALRGRADRIGALRRRVQAGATLAICDVVAAEVASGMLRKEEAGTLAFLESLRFLPASREAAVQAGRWRSAFRVRGITLSVADCLIAATAREHGAALATDNGSHYPMAGIEVIGGDAL